MISFRRLRREDFPLLVGWLAKPHVDAWWNERMDSAGVAEKYGPSVDGKERSYVYVIEYGGAPVGWIQWYRWRDYWEHAVKLGAGEDSAGVDLAIGEEEMLGRGIGPLALREFIERVVFADAAMRTVVSDPEERNTRSVRAFEKAGFAVVKRITLPEEDCVRCVVVLKRAS